jgi:acyl-CoA thioesterase-1
VKKLLIAGDSLSMSRHEFGIDYEKMYSSGLAASFPGRLVVNASLRANSTRRIVSDDYLQEYIRPMQPNVIILQIGVVDCLPRLLGDFERKCISLLSRATITGKLTAYYLRLKTAHRYAITKKHPRTIVPQDEFDRNLKVLRKNAPSGCRFIIINIPHPGDDLIKKSYGVAENIQRYNASLAIAFNDENSIIVDLYGATIANPNYLLADGYHISSIGHAFLFQKLSKLLVSMDF